ncbi:MBL fold metallo-hydrolase [Ignisphaera sp. 4213-co]|uniref:MBL fold metallo-hydrolase n=1 Tax=Ignisphaera cupida TaxID=3050454 RepID=A0ABD4Z5P9_9CREN|nr:MBL fold metallo-hydrolase [Ignisphaera sp. 4213-co]MDK6028627.1 MBL fold metallo-hydrolase [Ignisphaera sp. 4213-co]
MVKILFLGVGGWISNPLLGYTSFAVINSKGNWILVEAGEGAYQNIVKCGLKINDNLKGIVISHRHGDHILGLPTILQIAKHLGIKEVTIIGIDDVIEAVSELITASASQNTANIVKAIRLDFGEKIKIDDFEIEFLESVHTIPAASIKIIANGKCIVYSGDTSYNPRLADFARKCDVLIHEVSSYSEEAHKYGHSTYKDAFEIALKSNVKTLVLTHFYQWPQPIKTPIEGSMEILVPHPCQILEI